MNRRPTSFALLAVALAASVLVSACGGGDAGAPDSVAPTVTITSSAAGTTATAAVTFSFSFSEDVGTSFTAEDIVVSGGAAGAFTRLSGTQATLVVTPAAGGAGNVSVSVAASKFNDAANNPNAVAASLEQAYNTGVVAVSGNTGTCSAAPCIGFESATLGLEPFEGLGAATVVADPADASNKVLKVVKVPAGQPWAGVTVYTSAAAKSVDAIGLATSKLVTLRVYSPAAGKKIRLKIEDAGDPTVSMEVDATTTQANAWETLSFDFATPAAGTYNAAKTYNKLSVFPEFLTAVTVDTTFYFDELKYAAAAAAGGGGGAAACTAPACVDFSAAAIGFGPFENQGGGTVAVVADPTNATNKVAKFVKKPGDGDYFGTTVTGLGGSIVLTADKKTITMKVWSPAAGTNFLLKLEGGAGGATAEKDMVTTQAGAWETLSFELPAAGSYTTLVIFPNGRSAVTAEKTMYVDDISFPAFTASGGGGAAAGGFTGGIYAAEYSGNLAVAGSAKSNLGGEIGFYYAPELAATKLYDFGGIGTLAENPGGVPNFYFGFGLNKPAITNAYFGAYVNAPGNATVDVSGFSNLKANVWGPQEAFEKGFTPQVSILLTGPVVAGCAASSSSRSELQASVSALKIGAASNYTVPLSSFTIKVACNGETTVAQVLKNVAQVHFQLLNTNIQYTVADTGSPAAYPNGLNVGPVKFD